MKWTEVKLKRRQLKQFQTGVNSAMRWTLKKDFESDHF